MLDSSAVISILLLEPEAAQFASAIAGGTSNLLSAGSLIEASIVIENRRGIEGARDLDLLIYRAGIEIVPVASEQVEIARAGWRKYGKGRHPAGLNYGDCFFVRLGESDR